LLSDSFHLIVGHIWLSVIAALLFVAGLGTAVPVVRNDCRWLMAFPLWIVRQVLRIVGPGLPPVRVFLLIFLFNSIAIFLYMLSGVLLVLPAAVAFLTGVNIGVVVLRGGEIQLPSGERPLAAAGAEHGRAVPSWVSLCTLAVFVLELPSFWVAVGMGIGMGNKLSAADGYTLANLQSLLLPRIYAYLLVIVPALFISALAETAAIRGHAAAGPPAAGRDGDGGSDNR